MKRVQKERQRSNSAIVSSRRRLYTAPLQLSAVNGAAFLSACCERDGFNSATATAAHALVRSAVQQSLADQKPAHEGYQSPGHVRGHSDTDAEFFRLTSPSQPTSRPTSACRGVALCRPSWAAWSLSTAVLPTPIDSADVTVMHAMKRKWRSEARGLWQLQSGRRVNAQSESSTSSRSSNNDEQLGVTGAWSIPAVCGCVAVRVVRALTVGRWRSPTRGWGGCD